jgi:hypothetical protein
MCLFRVLPSTSSFLRWEGFFQTPLLIIPPRASCPPRQRTGSTDEFRFHYVLVTDLDLDIDIGLGIIIDHDRYLDNHTARRNTHLFRVEHASLVIARIP